jgi:hypothetical protein
MTSPSASVVSPSAASAPFIFSPRERADLLGERIKASYELSRAKVERDMLLGYEKRVGMTNRKNHAPTDESNEVLCQFFEHCIGGSRDK